MVAGTPRGFNLSAMPYGMPGLMSGLPPQPPYTTNFGQYPVQMPGVFAPPGGNFGYDPNGQVGPMRRGGGRFTNNNRTGGPYDRQTKDTRNARWAGNGGGRLTPPRNGRPATGVPRFPDAAGQAGANGPKEAVAGRTMKSYEDLDAAGGGATELNY